MRYAFVTLILLLSVASVAAQAPPAADAGPDVRRLQNGVFLYRDTDPGKRPGTSVITIRSTATACEISAVITLSPDFKDFRSQQWKTLSGPHLEPRSASLSSGEGASALPLFNLAYAGSQVTGSFFDRKHGGAERTVNARITAQTVDQRIDWARVLASDLTPGGRFHFQVYDPGLGVSQAFAQVAAAHKTLHLPAGTFDALEITYVIRKSTGTEEYRVYTTRRQPRILLREDFGNGVSTELVGSRNQP